MKRVLQAIVLLLAVGALIQTAANLAQADGPKINAHGGEPGI